jgi:DNA-binding IscR family transcriptional regulator
VMQSTSRPAAQSSRGYFRRGQKSDDRPDDGQIGSLPADIKIAHVVRVLDGPLAPIPCASRTQYQRCEDCDEARCRVRHMMLEVREAVAEVLDNRSLAQMRDAASNDMLLAADVM